jgi:hypothetical protein
LCADDFLVLYLLMRGETKGLDSRDLLLTIGKLLVPSALLALVCWSAQQWLFPGWRTSACGRSSLSARHDRRRRRGFLWRRHSSSESRSCMISAPRCTAAPRRAARSRAAFRRATLIAALAPLRDVTE